jgi:hypothetical protein
LIGKLGNDIKTASSATTFNGNNVRGEASAPSPKGKGKAPIQQHFTGDDDYGFEDDDDDNGEDPLEYDNVDDYLNHAYYRDMIAEGFCNRSPS